SSLEEAVSAISIDQNDDNPENIPDKETNNDENTLLGIPREMIIKIIEQKCFALEDRMNLRLTCKAMVSIVAECDYHAISKLSYKLTISRDRIDNRGTTTDHGYASFSLAQRGTEMPQEKRYITTIEGLFKDTIKIEEGRHEVFLRQLSRLFRHAYIEEVYLDHFDFRSGAPDTLLNVQHLLRLSDSISCDTLGIDLSGKCYAPCAFDVINKLNPRKTLELSPNTSVTIDQELLQNLPPVPYLVIKMSSSFRISDETVVAMVAKHRFISLGERSQSLHPDTLIKATKIIAEHIGHSIILTFHIDLVMETLERIGITMEGNDGEETLVSADPSIVVHREVKSNGDTNFEIALFGTKMKILRMFTNQDYRMERRPQMIIGITD
ncbi:hypothetical protein PENTCL1PPCAC_6116, partial [Pristionchus entomophagus]